MRKTDLTPDLIRDAPDGYGEGKAPAPTAVMPSRAIMDHRFNKYPMTMRVLAYCCGHAQKWTAQFWLNQKTIAADMQCSQQAVSQHMRKLENWGYIEKVKREDNRRGWGKKGATWRVIFNPLEAVKEPVDKSIITQAAPCIKNNDDNSLHKPQLVSLYKPHLVSNYYNRTIDKKDNNDDCRRVCNSFSQAITERYGRGWVYDQRQMTLAGELLDMGYTPQSFDKDMRSMLDWMVKNNKQPPQSLQYFITRRLNTSKQKQQHKPQDILKSAVRGLRM